MMNTYTPIVLFAYNRPEHTQRTVDALAKNEFATESDLIVFSDGPKDESGVGKINAVRNYLRTIDGFKSVIVNESERNHGLADSIIAGVSEVVNQCGRIIVLEDDMITSPYFLRYMNEALDLYANEERVISIHGYCYPVKEQLPETFFLNGADCWGWGTWKRGWDLFEPDGEKLLSRFKTRQQRRELDFDGVYPFYKMLEDQAHGKVDSWAVRWRASALLRDKLTLYPGISLINNIGVDGSGMHCFEQNMENPGLAQRPIKLKRQNLEVSRAAFVAFRKYLKSINIPFSKKILFKLKSAMRKLSS